MHHAAVASSFLSLASIGLLAGCSYPPLDPLPGSMYGIEHKDLPLRINRDLDLLFVIDDSPSMADKQINLAASFPGFIDVLETIPGGLPNIHIGVVTSDLGSRGADSVVAPSVGLPGSGGCSGLGKAGNMQLFGAQSMVSGGLFLSDIESMPGGPRIRNYTYVNNDSLSTTFSQMARAGAGGCGFEQHLEAMKQALVPTNTANAGFLRPDAYLAVIFLADEDDCSMLHATMLGPEDATLGPRQSFRCTRFGVLCDDNGATTDAMNEVGTKTQCHPNDDSPYLTKVSDYARFLKGLKTDPYNVIVAGIMGPTEPFAVDLRPPSTNMAPIPALAHSCTYVGGDGKPEVADPPIRLRSFLDEFQFRSAVAPVCDASLSGGLQQIGTLLKDVLIGNPCIESKLADVDPKALGAQFDCAVSVVTDRGSPAQSESVMPKCSPEDASATNQPCWHLATDAASCPTSDHLKLKIEGIEMISGNTHVVANCATEPQ